MILEFYRVPVKPEFAIMVALILKAWKYCWGRFAAAFLLSAGIGYAVLWALSLDPQSLFHASTMGVRRVAIPAIERASLFGVDPAIVIFLANAMVAFILASFIFSARLYDPGRTDKLSVWIRNQAQNDPIVTLLRPWSAFRAIKKPALKPLYTSLVVAPATGSVALGVLIGLLFSSHVALTGGGPKSALIALAYLLPHGLPEVGGLLLGAAIPLSGYFGISENLRQGDVETSFSELYRVGSARSVLPILGAAAALLIGAAVIEAHLTALVGQTVAGLL